MSNQPAERPSQRDVSRRWESTADHGIVTAVALAAREGQDVALEWFAQHEELPPYGAADCSLPPEAAQETAG